MNLVVSPDASQHIKARLGGVITVVPPAQLVGAGCCGGGNALRPALALAGPPGDRNGLVSHEVSGVVVFMPLEWEQASGEVRVEVRKRLWFRQLSVQLR